MLDDKDIEFTKALYRAFYSRYPDDNPTDINTLNKYEFMKEIGYDCLKKMQSARKMNTKPNGYPCPWTKRDHWKGDLF